MTNLLEIFWLVIFLTLANPDMFAASALDLELPDNSQSQCGGISRGKRFLLGFIDTTDDPRSGVLYIWVVAFSNQQTTVTISSKHKIDGTPFQETFEIEAGGFIRTNIPIELVMENNGRSKKVLEISASSDVSAYGLMDQFRSNYGFLGIPTNNLGMQYVVTTSRPPNPQEGSEFAVIGTKDSTLVQVTLRGAVEFEGITYSPGDVLRFTVNGSEAVQIQGQRLGDLTGSIIQSDKPVAVFSGNECTIHAHGSCDAAAEQLIPVESWGQKHIYTAARSDDNNIYRIVAYFSETNLTIPGLEQQSLEPGEFWEGRLTGSGLVTSSKPALMMQHLASINGRIVDPSIIQIPAVEHFGFVFRFTTPTYPRSFSEGFFNFINIIVKKESRETVYLNDSPINDTMTVHEIEVPNTNYMSLTVQLPKGEAVYYVEQTDPDSSPLSVIVYGYEELASYGYAAGLSLPSNEQTLRLTPYYLRELGGERFTMTVPCLETLAISSSNSKCKFSTGIGDVLVPGERTDAYTVVCVTPTFYKNGLTSVSVSLDNGESFPYSGIVYVASVEDLPPLVKIQQMNSLYTDGIIDLTSDNPILLSWDPSSLGEGVSHLDVMMQDTASDNDGNPVLMEGVEVKTNVFNSGYLTIPPGELVSLGGDGLSLQAIYLIPSAERKRFLPGLLVAPVKITTTIVATVVGTCTVSRYQIQSTVPTGLPACPCNTDQADQDQNLQVSNFKNSFFHPGSENCYRSVNALPTGAGQQCCYGADGNIVVGPPGGGTADRYGPGGFASTILHQWFDVLPWLCLCKLSNNCNEYYKYRPSDDCSEYDPARPAGGTGDPHLTSLDGYRFTFNGAGEFIMASSAVHELIFQARMERYRNTNASVYTAFVLQTNDSSKVQVQMSSMNETLILVDGEALRLDLPFRIHHLRGVRISFNSDMSKINIVFSAGIAVTVNINPEVMSFIAQLDTKFKGQVRGLLGNLNENPDDDLQFPNGTTLEPGSSLKEIHEYGLEWLVAQEDSIFTYISPYEYGTYYFPEFSPTFMVPDLNNVSQEIKDLCGNSIECVFDAVITGSLSFANETKMVTVEIDEVQKGLVKIVSCGYPGDVQNASVSGSVFFVNATVEVACDDGFILKGVSRLTCLEDGRWSSDLPVCSEMMKDGRLAPGIIAAVIVGAVIAALVLIVLISGVIYILKKRKATA